MNVDFVQSVVRTLTGFNAWSVAFRIILAAIVGGCVGSERGRRGQAAGLRTHILVCLGASITSMVGLYAALELGFNNDPMRVAAQVISGIGFLGAGTIINRNNSHVTGLTTAAGLWTTASIGIAIGIGFYWAVAVAFAVVWFSMSILVRFESHRRALWESYYYIEVNDISQINRFYELVKSAELRVVPAKSNAPGHLGLEMAVSASPEEASALVDQIRVQDYVIMVVPIGGQRPWTV